MKVSKEGNHNQRQEFYKPYYVEHNIQSVVYPLVTVPFIVDLFVVSYFFPFMNGNTEQAHSTLS